MRENKITNKERRFRIKVLSKKVIWVKEVLTIDINEKKSSKHRAYMEHLADRGKEKEEIQEKEEEEKRLATMVHMSSQATIVLLSTPVSTVHLSYPSASLPHTSLHSHFLFLTPFSFLVWLYSSLSSFISSPTSFRPYIFFILLNQIFFKRHPWIYNNSSLSIFSSIILLIHISYFDHFGVYTHFYLVTLFTHFPFTLPISLSYPKYSMPQISNNIYLFY